MSRHRALRQATGRITGRWQSEAVRRTARGGVAIALVASGVVACTTTNAPTQPRTAVVERTSVTSGVAASGSLASLTSQNLGFTKGGQLTAVDVKVGDHVTAGEVLANIDPFPAQQSLNQAQSQLASQQAALTRLTTSPVVQGNQASLDQARTILSKTKDQANAVQDADQTAIDNANRQLDTDKKTLDKAQDALRSAQSACNAASSGLASGSGSSGSGSSGSTSTGTGSPGTGSSHSGSWGNGSSNAAMNAMMMGSVAAASAPTTPTACTQVASAQSAVASAKSTVTADRNNVDAAQQKKDVDNQSGKLSIANAQQEVVSAQNALNSSASDRQPTINQQAGQVAAAQSAVDQAARDLQDTTLRAPVDGVVSALNGATGEFVAPSANTSALAPGSDATIPGTGGDSAASAAAPGGSASPVRPGGTQFLVLDNVDEFQVVLAFAETDAAAITAGQKVQLTFDAVPDLTLQGSVLSVSPTGTAISSVISYYVTVVLPKGDPRLKSGMTAQAEVLTRETPNVLAVPSAAVHTANGRGVVTVVQPDGTQRSAPVQTGVTGDGKTQILSGLTEGQQVVLPAAP